MYYSLLDVRTNVRNKSDEYQTQRIQNPELDTYINDALDYVVSIVFPLNEQYFTKTLTRNLVSGTSGYYLPHDCKALIDVDLSTDNGSNYYRAKEVNIDRRNYKYDGSFTGSPFTYYYLGNKIELLSTSHGASTNGVKFIYTREHPELDADSHSGSVSYCSRTSEVIAVTADGANQVENGELFTLSSMNESTYDGTYRYDSTLITSLTEWATGTAYTAGQHIRNGTTIYKVVNNFTSSTLAGMTDWATGQAYVAGNYYDDSGVVYKVLSNHNSTTIAADIAAGDLGVSSLLAKDISDGNLADVTSTTLTCRQEGLADDSTAVTAGTLYRRTPIDLPGGRTAIRLLEAWAVRTVLMRDEKDITGVDKTITFLAGRLKKNLNPRTRARSKRIRLTHRYRGWR